MKDILNSAIQTLVRKDLHLLQVDANECTITHKLACHLQALVPSFDVDCDYNRNQESIKVLKSYGFDESNVAPDIIVHRRGTNDNRLVIEAKKESASKEDKDSDRRKLRAFKEDLGYQLAAFLIIRTGQNNSGIDPPEWIGREVAR